jgi:hypothetical protein
VIRSVLLLLVLLLPVSLTQATDEQVNEIYETYLPAEKLVPVLQPMLGPEDRITPFRNKLIVRAPRHRQDNILELLEELDRPLRNILISVRYGNSASAESSARDVDVRYRDADRGVRIDAGAQPDDQVVVYKGSSRDDKIQVRAVSKNRFSTENENTLSQIRVLEGTQGFLQVGKEMPQNQFVLLHPAGFGNTTEYRMVGSGIYVVPQIVKDKVRLELFTSQQKPQSDNRNVIEKTDAQSVLLVEPDVWTPFAGTNTSVQSQGSGKVYSTRDLQQGNKALELKVTILD